MISLTDTISAASSMAFIPARVPTTSDDFFDAVREELEEGRELYRSRVSPDLFQRTNFYDRAIVDVILRSKGHVKSKIW